jgi:hypothetical protein
MDEPTNGLKRVAPPIWGKSRDDRLRQWEADKSSISNFVRQDILQDPHSPDGSAIEALKAFFNLPPFNPAQTVALLEGTLSGKVKADAQRYFPELWRGK